MDRVRPQNPKRRRTDDRAREMGRPAPPQTPSGGGPAPTPDRSKTPAAGSALIGVDNQRPVTEAVGVQRDLRALEHAQQLGLAPVQARQQPVEDHVAGAAGEDPVEPRPQRRRPPRAGVALPGLQILWAGERRPGVRQNAAAHQHSGGHDVSIRHRPRPGRHPRQPRRRLRVPGAVALDLAGHLSVARPRGEDVQALRPEWRRGGPAGPARAAY